MANCQICNKLIPENGEKKGYHSVSCSCEIDNIGKTFYLEFKVTTDSMGQKNAELCEDCIRALMERWNETLAKDSELKDLLEFIAKNKERIHELLNKDKEMNND